MNKIARMAASQRADLFGETANRIGISGAVVEKDFWVCWVLKQLFSIEAFSHRLLFKGGTSLSKIFHAINRFSEDIDLAVDYAALGFAGPRDPRRGGLSRPNRPSSSPKCFAIAGAISRVSSSVNFGPAAKRSSARKETGARPLDDRDPNIVHFRYPAAVTVRHAYISPQVVMELGTHAEFIPRGEFTIRPFAAEEFPHLFADSDVRVTALLAKRTFWEKATILHAEYHRSPGKHFPARYSRHYYDVAMLSQTPIKDEALADLQLLKDVVRHKKTFYPAAWARYDLAVPGTLKLTPSSEIIATWRR